jgi:hypothetical protein
MCRLASGHIEHLEIGGRLPGSDANGVHRHGARIDGARRLFGSRVSAVRNNDDARHALLPISLAKRAKCTREIAAARVSRRRRVRLQRSERVAKRPELRAKPPGERRLDVAFQKIARHVDASRPRVGELHAARHIDEHRDDGIACRSGRHHTDWTQQTREQKEQRKCAQRGKRRTPAR